MVEMIRAAGDTGATMTRDLAIAIIRYGKAPADWEQSFIVCLNKGNVDALDRGTENETMKVIERIADSLIRQVVTINE